MLSYGSPVDYLVYLGEEGLLDLALTEEQVGKTRRGWLLFQNIKALTISDMNKSVGDSFAEVSYYQFHHQLSIRINPDKQ